LFGRFILSTTKESFSQQQVQLALGVADYQLPVQEQGDQVDCEVEFEGGEHTNDQAGGSDLDVCFCHQQCRWHKLDKQETGLQSYGSVCALSHCCCQSR
jgi:hypothetical protein